MMHHKLDGDAIKTIGGLAWAVAKSTSLPYRIPGIYSAYDADRILNLCRRRARDDGYRLSGRVDQRDPDGCEILIVARSEVRESPGSDTMPHVHIDEHSDDLRIIVDMIDENREWQRVVLDEDGFTHLVITVGYLIRCIDSLSKIIAGDTGKEASNGE